MELRNHGSGSSGNLQTIVTEAGAFMFEAGITPKQAMARGFDPTLPAFALVTHAHKDHGGYAKDYMERGIPVWASDLTAGKIGGFGVVPLVPFSPHKGFQAIAFPVEHDSPGSCGFVVRAGGETIAYMMDCKKPACDLSGTAPDWLILECDYIAPRLDVVRKSDEREVMRNSMRARKAGQDLVKLNRQATWHSSLSDTIANAKAFDLSKCKGIFIGHLSERFAEGPAMARAVSEKTGVRCAWLRREGGIGTI